MDTVPGIANVTAPPVPENGGTAGTNRLSVDFAAASGLDRAMAETAVAAPGNQTAAAPVVDLRNPQRFAVLPGRDPPPVPVQQKPDDLEWHGGMISEAWPCAQRTGTRFWFESFLIPDRVSLGVGGFVGDDHDGRRRWREP